MSRTNIVFGFISGVALRSFLDPGLSFSAILFFISFFLFISQYFYKNCLSKEVNLKNCAVIFLFISIGFIWYEYRVPKPFLFLERLENKAVSLRAQVISEPEEKDGKLKIIVETEDSGITNKILVRAPAVLKYKYGDVLQIIGEIKKPENFSDSFDYISYLAKDDIYFIMDDPKIRVVSFDEDFSVSRYLFLIKDNFVDRINKILPEPHSSLLSGLILGARESLGVEWVNKFRTTGLSHIVVLSGYNLTIIADATMKIISGFFARSVSVFVGAVSIILFTIMTGGGASTIRAAIMALIILLAKTTGRVYEASSALILAGVLMILHDPRVLVFDMSFQLSFLATLGLLYISPILKKYLTFVTERFELRELLATTIGAQLATFPLIVYKIGTLSLVSLPANMLVLLFIPATMFFGFLAVILNFFSYYVAIPFVAIAWVLLSYELFIVDAFSSLPMASISIDTVNLFYLLLALLGLFFIYRFRRYLLPEEHGWKIEEI